MAKVGKARKEKKKKEAIGDLKKAFKQRLKEKKKKPKIKFTPPPYDDIYFEGPAATVFQTEN